MKTTINERLNDIIQYYDRSVSAFAKNLGVAQGTVSTMLTRSKSLSSSFIEEVLKKYPAISAEWFLTGEGAMIKEEYNPPFEELYPIETRPRIPYTASAGYLTSSVNGVTDLQCEQIPIITAFPTYDFTILIKGDSMYPNYEGGDEVACKRIDSTSFIQWGKVHVLDTAQGIVIKRVYEDGGDIKCVSYNKEYPDFTIQKDEVYSMSLVVGLLRL